MIISQFYYNKQAYGFGNNNLDKKSIFRNFDKKKKDKESKNKRKTKHYVTKQEKKRRKKI